MRAAIGAVPGLLFIGVGCVAARYASIRIGIGRHGDVWWRPFVNSVGRAHVENLAVFALGIIGIVFGACLAVSAVRRSLGGG
jgi:hypothetical protein